MKLSAIALPLVFLGVIAAPLQGVAAEEVSQRSVPDGICPYVAISAERVLLTNVTLQVGDGSDPRENFAVLIDGETIAAVRPADELETPDDALVINLDGRTVMPGIVGMHNHLHMPGNRLLAYTAPRLYLAGGVTTIMTAGSADAAGELVLAKEITAGQVPGPKVYASAPYVTGPGGNRPMAKPADTGEVYAFVDTWADAGVAWFKIYRHTQPAIAAALIAAAHERGLKVTGHLCSITFREAAEMGIDSLEHGLNAAADFVTAKPEGECVPTRAATAALRPDSPEIAELVKLLVDNDVTVTSTLAILETGFPHRPQADRRSLQALAPSRVTAYEARQAQLADSRSTTRATAALWELLLAFERQFVSAGGRLVAGPDTGRHILPGFGDQRNFELLAEAGFSVPEVVKIMTYNGADALGISEHSGLVAAGYRADLVVIDGDLTSDPSSIRQAELLFKGGLGFDPVRLIDDVGGTVGDR